MAYGSRAPFSQGTAKFCGKLLHQTLVHSVYLRGTPRSSSRNSSATPPTTITMDTYGTFSLGEMQQMIASKTGDRLPARNPHMKGLHSLLRLVFRPRLGRGP